MTLSTAIPTPVEAASEPVRTPSEAASKTPALPPVDRQQPEANRRLPAIELCGVKVFVQRDGDHVTGKVVFPHVVGGDLTQAAKAYREGKRITGRTECTIDYHSKRPDETRAAGDSDPACRSPRGLATTEDSADAADARADIKLHLVRKWHRLRESEPKTPKGVLTQRVVNEAKADGVKRISVSSLRHWANKFELEGAKGLRDRYVKPARRVESFTADQAKAALTVCAWWAYRIGNVTTIDTKMMKAAVDLIDEGHQVADLVATIDCYYSWKCDRERYAFKPFGRWARYELDKWILRTAAVYDYRRAIAEGRTEQTPLQTVECPRKQRTVATQATRRRDASNHRTRAEIAKLADPPADQPDTRTAAPPAAGDREPAEQSSRGEAPRAAGLAMPACWCPREPSSTDQAPSAPDASPTIAEAMAALDDPWRVMLLRASGRDADPDARRARDEAVATLPQYGGTRCPRQRPARSTRPTSSGWQTTPPAATPPTYSATDAAS